MRMAYSLAGMCTCFYRAISSFETVLESVVMNMDISVEPIVIEGEDAALLLQRVNNNIQVIFIFDDVIFCVAGTKRDVKTYWSDICCNGYSWNRG